MEDLNGLDDATAVALVVSFGPPCDQVANGNSVPLFCAAPSAGTTAAVPAAAAPPSPLADALQCADALASLLALCPAGPALDEAWAGIAVSPDCRTTVLDPVRVVQSLREKFSDRILRMAGILVGPAETLQLHPALHQQQDGLLIAVRDPSGRSIIDLLTPAGLLSATTAPMFVIITPAAHASGAALRTSPAGTDQVGSGSAESDSVDARDFAGSRGDDEQEGDHAGAVYATCSPPEAALFHSLDMATVLLQGLDTLSFSQWDGLEAWRPVIPAVPGCRPIVESCDPSDLSPPTVPFPRGAHGTSIDGPELVFVACDVLNLSADVPPDVVSTLEMLHDGAESLLTDFDDWLNILSPAASDLSALGWRLQFCSLQAVRDWFSALDHCPLRKLAEFCQQFAPAEPPPSLVEARARLVAALCEPDAELFHPPGHYRKLYDVYVEAGERESVGPMLAKAQAEDSKHPALAAVYRQLAAAARRLHGLEPFLSIDRIPDGLQRSLGLKTQSVQECYDAWQKRFTDIGGKFFQKQKPGL